MATLTNFGEQFAGKVLKKTYANSVMQAIVNRDYEGEIKKPGDRVNILSFLNDVLFSDYTVGSDMNSETIVDAEDVLIVEKRKYSNFSLDRLEDLFTYGSDVPSQLLDNTAKVLERLVDEYVLSKACEASVKNWVGVNLLVPADSSGGTHCSLTTTATGGTIYVQGNFTAGNFGYVENPLDGNTYMGGFEQCDVGKGIRLCSSRTFVSPWYRISTVTDSVQAAVTEWDGATSGSDFEEGYTLRGTFGGDGRNFPKYGAGDASLVGMTYLGWEFQAAIATSISSSSIYNQVTLLAEKLDDSEVPDTGRHLVVPPAIQTQLRQSSALQPTGIAELYLGTVVNGRVMRVGAFDVHVAVGSRVSTRAGKSTAAADNILTTGATGYQIPAVHTGMITFADKWSESRVVDAENQFAKKYQGLYLYGAKVPAYRRKYGAILFGNF